MGGIYYARCPCGFEQAELFEGYGMNEKGGCTTLHACDTCRIIFTLNSNKKKSDLFGEQNICPGCGNSAVCTYTVDLDSDEEHHCPACRKMTLKFLPGGLWD